MKLSAKTGVALTITALSLVVTVGAGASDSAYLVEEDPLVFLRQVPVYTAHVSDSAYLVEEDPLVFLRQVPVYTARVSDSAYLVEEDPLVFLRQVPASAANVDMMNQLRNLTEANAIKWGWSQGLANDRASAGKT